MKFKQLNIAIQPNGMYIISTEPFTKCINGDWVSTGITKTTSSFVGHHLFPEAQPHKVAQGYGAITARYMTVYENDPAICVVLNDLHLKVVYYDPNDECILCGFGRMCSISREVVTNGFRAPIKNAQCFLAATALNDEDDYMQWFLDEVRNEVLLCRAEKMLLSNMHKLTPKEIAEIFDI